MWRYDDLWGVLADATYALVGDGAPDASGRGRARSRGRSSTAARHRVHLPASPLMHGTGAFTSFQALFLGGRIVTLVGRHFDPHELWQTRAARARHADGDRRRRVREADAARARRSRSGRRRRTTSRRSQLIISSGVMWSAEVKQALMAARQLHLLRLARLERRRRVRRLDHRAGRRAEDREVLDRRATPRCSTRTASEVVPGSGEVGLLAVGGNIPVGYYKDEAKIATPRSSTINGDALVGAGRLRERRGRRHDHAARPRLGRHQLGRREDLPRRGRGSGEACIPRSPTASSSACPTNASAKRSPRSSRCAPGADSDAPTSSAARSRRCRAFKRPRHFVIVPEVAARPERQGRLQVGQGSRRRRRRLTTRHSRNTNEGRPRAVPRTRRAAPTSPELLLLRLPPLSTLASTSRALRISTSSPSTVISVPPYFE